MANGGVVRFEWICYGTGVAKGPHRVLPFIHVDIVASQVGVGVGARPVGAAVCWPGQRRRDLGCLALTWVRGVAPLGGLAWGLHGAARVSLSRPMQVLSSFSPGVSLSPRSWAPVGCQSSKWAVALFVQQASGPTSRRAERAEFTGLTLRRAPLERPRGGSRLRCRKIKKTHTHTHYTT